MYSATGAAVAAAAAFEATKLSAYSSDGKQAAEQGKDLTRVVLLQTGE
jgi:hypothetical protein